MALPNHHELLRKRLAVRGHAKKVDAGRSVFQRLPTQHFIARIQVDQTLRDHPPGHVHRVAVTGCIERGVALVLVGDEGG